jgi:predicted nucleic acid-binding protein
MAIPKRLVLDTDIIMDRLIGKSASSLVSRLQDECALATTQLNSFELETKIYAVGRAFLKAGEFNG